MPYQNLFGHNDNKEKKFIYVDDSLNSVAVVVDDVAYDTGLFLDRDYDVRGMAGASIQLENTGANSIDIEILGSTKWFDKDALDTSLVDADFDEVLVAEAALGAATKKALYTVDLTNADITAIRIRAKETVGGSPGAILGEVKAY